MSKIFRKSYDIKMPKSQHEFEEFGPGKKGLVMCSECNAVYFKKYWHHGLKNIVISEKKDLPIKFILCPACAMIKNKQYEGRITVKNVSEKQAQGLEELIEGFCRRAFERDPMDRLIKIKTGKNWEITVTENELANKLTNKIKNIFNKVRIKRKFNKEPGDVAEITIEPY